MKLIKKIKTNFRNLKACYGKFNKAFKEWDSDKVK